MSKFFKALEQAERDRAEREARPPETPVAAPAPTDPAPPPVAPPRLESRAPDPGASPSLPVDATTGRRPHAASLSGNGQGRVEEHLVSLLFPSTFEAEQYRGLRHVVEQHQGASGLAVIAVTSPAVGDGKTTTAINLAGALAQAPGARVLLIDADLRRPSVAEHLGLAGRAHAERPGLVDALVDPRYRLDALVEPRPEFNLAVIVAGPAPRAPYELVQSPRFAELLAEARQRFQYVILDTPPLVAVPDSRLIVKMVDGLLLVVGAHRTPRKLVEEALSLVDPAKLLGLVFNQDDRPLSGYYRDYRGHRAHGSGPTNGHASSRWERLLRRGPQGGPAVRR